MDLDSSPIRHYNEIGTECQITNAAILVHFEKPATRYRFRALINVPV